MILYTKDNDKIHVIKCEKPSKGPMWESDLKYIDSESLYFYFNVSRGKYYYFDYEKQWYKTKMDILPDILGIPSVMLDGHKEFFTAKKSWHELWSGIITKM